MPALETASATSDDEDGLLSNKNSDTEYVAMAPSAEAPSAADEASAPAAEVGSSEA